MRLFQCNLVINRILVLALWRLDSHMECKFRVEKAQFVLENVVLIDIKSRLISCHTKERLVQNYRIIVQLKTNVVQISLQMCILILNNV